MRVTTRVDRLVRLVELAIALSIFSMVGCRPSVPPKTTSQPQMPIEDSGAAEANRLPISSTQDSGGDEATNRPLTSSSQDSITQPEDTLPTLPTTPINALPSNDFSQSITLNPESDVGNHNAPTKVLTKGTFMSGEQPTHGGLIIVDDEGTPIIELGHDFQTENGPDLAIVLHQAANPLTTTQPPAYRLKHGDYVEIASLKSHRGQQRYSIPAAIILDNYNSIAIRCRKSDATFGVASFEWDK